MAFSLREYNKKHRHDNIVSVSVSLNKYNKIDKQLIDVVKSQENQSDFIKRALLCYIHILNGTNQPQGCTNYGIYRQTEGTNKKTEK